MLGFVDVGEVTDENVGEIVLLTLDWVMLDDGTLVDDILDVWGVLDEDEIVEEEETGAAPGILSGPGV